MGQITLIGNEEINWIDRILRSKDLECEYLRSLNEVNGELSGIQTVIVNMVGGNGVRVMEDLRKLRLEIGFRGPVIVLSFVPKGRILGQQGHGAIEMAGCLYFQLPFLIDEFLEVLTPSHGLSDEKMQQVCKAIRASHLFQRARTLGHDYENEFGITLANLREIEKLSHFDNVDVEKVMKEIGRATAGFSREMIDQLRKEVANLTAEVTELGGAEGSGNLVALSRSWGEIERWFQLSDALGNETENSLPLIFERAKETRIAIKNILEKITTVKERAQEVMRDAR